MQYSNIAKIFQTRYLFSKAQYEENKNTSNTKESTEYTKITHNPLELFFKQNSKKKVIGNRAESKLIFGSTFYKWYLQI